MVISVLSSAIDFYSTLIIIYIIMSWFPLKGVLLDIQRVLGTLVEPYLGLFRRVIPLVGNLDFSPVIAIIVLSILQRLLVILL